jgi:hypothetical protein
MNAPSAFDPNVFLDAQQTEVNEKRPPVPTENPDDPNGLYTAVIGEIKTDAGTIGKGEKLGQPWVSMVIPLKLQIPAVIQALGLPAEMTITDRAFLDLTPQGGIDNAKGKNRQQRAYRDATGTNVPGEAFAWRMLTGRVVKVKIAHELYNEVLQEKIAAILPS